jgi:hypothetical protein
MNMTFEEAARKQYLYSSFYTVWGVDRQGERIYLTCTQRKSGRRLIGLLSIAGPVREWVLGVPGIMDTDFKKTATSVSFSNGYRVEFGDTIRQEAAVAKLNEGK